jgi:curved DNA-binding protein CbpA
MTNQMTDPYATLGVPRTATQSQVREAYRRKAKQVHPDVARDAQATERMRRINQAWQTLSSPAARARYDAQSAAAPSMAYPHWATAPRRPRQPYAAQRAWTAGAGVGDYTMESEAGPLRWAVTVAGVLVAAFVLAAIFGGAFPLFGLVLFFVARALLRLGD